MSRILIWSLALALALGVSGCKTAPEQGPAAPPTGTSASETPYPLPFARQPAADSSYEELVLTVEIPVRPPAPERQPGVPAGPHGGAGCPKTECSQLLGIDISSPHGIVVSKVLPGGPAEKAGIKVGDSIVACNGNETSCPSSLRPMLGSGVKVVTVELTIRRPKSSETDAKSAEKPAEPAGGTSAAPMGAK
jgi:membrane-associated protease RseP (regulator of RpoE activity)